MKWSILFAITLICASETSAKRKVHVYLNIGNCKSHSSQISQLSNLNNSINKIIHISSQDSAITPWIIDQFGLKDTKNLFFVYHSQPELAQKFGRMGQSMVIFIFRSDTVSTFEIEALPNHIAEINSFHNRMLKRKQKKLYNVFLQPDEEKHVIKTTSHLNPLFSSPQAKQEMSYIIYKKYDLLDKESFNLSSEVQISGKAEKVWILDKFLGELYLIKLMDASSYKMIKTKNWENLFFSASNIDSAMSYFAQYKHELNVEMISHIDKEENAVLLVNLTVLADSTRNLESNLFYRFLMTVNDSSAVIEQIDTQPTNSISPFIGASGFNFVGDTLIAQVMTDKPDELFSPLFGYYTSENNKIKINSATPYNYRTDVWSKLGPYHFVNGNFSSRFFGFCLAPIVVDLYSWNQYDVSNQLNVSTDSSISMVPGHFYAIDIESDNNGLGMLCMIKSKLYLIQFAKLDDALLLENSLLIDSGDFDISEACLIDRYSFIFTNTRKNKLLFGKMMRQ